MEEIPEIDSFAEVRMSRRPYRTARRKSVTDFAGPGFYVLLALMESRVHASEVQRRIIEIGMGRWIGDSTLRDEVGRLERAGLVTMDRRRWPKVLAITPEGRRVLGLRVVELSHVLEVAKRRGLC